jgi:hypothetical protein
LLPIFHIDKGVICPSVIWTFFTPFSRHQFYFSFNMADLAEKQPYAVQKPVAGANAKFENQEERRHSLAGDEAADVYGNAGSAAEYGYVERG